MYIIQKGKKMIEKYYSQQQIADLLSVSVQTIKRYRKSGLLVESEGLWVGREYRHSEAEVKAFFERLKNAPKRKYKTPPGKSKKSKTITDNNEIIENKNEVIADNNEIIIDNNETILDNNKIIANNNEKKRKTPKKPATDEQKQEIYEMYKSGIQKAKIAKKIGYAHSVIGRYIKEIEKKLLETSQSEMPLAMDELVSN